MDMLKSSLPVDVGDLGIIFKVMGGLKYVKISLKLIYLLNLCLNFDQSSTALHLMQ